MNYFTRLLVLQRSDTGTMTIFLCYEHGEDYNRALLPSQHGFFFRTPEIKEEKKTDERMDENSRTLAPSSTLRSC